MSIQFTVPRFEHMTFGTWVLTQNHWTRAPALFSPYNHCQLYCFQCRPTPPHLTSVQAEQLLARACENESDNAKRMRMGLEPISQPMPIFTTQPNLIDVLASCSSMTMTPTQHLFPNMSALNPIEMKTTMTTTATNGAEKQLKTEYKPEQLASLLQAAASQPIPVMMTSAAAVTNSSPQMTQTLAAGLPQSPLLPTTFPGLNGATLYRPPFQPATTFPQSAAILQQQQQQQQQQQTVIQNGKRILVDGWCNGLTV